jgi:hypothetical protein
MIRRALLGVLASLFAGCNVAWQYDMSAYFTRVFAERYICPEDRVSKRDRLDLPYRRFVCPGAAGCEEAKESPPAELAGDPERIALWRRLTREKAGPKPSLDDRVTTTVEITGCGHHHFYACSTFEGGRRDYVPYCTGGKLIDLGEKEP